MKSKLGLQIVRLLAFLIFPVILFYVTPKIAQAGFSVVQDPQIVNTVVSFTAYGETTAMFEFASGELFNGHNCSGGAIDYLQPQDVYPVADIFSAKFFWTTFPSDVDFSFRVTSIHSQSNCLNGHTPVRTTPIPIPIPIPTPSPAPPGFSPAPAPSVPPPAFVSGFTCTWDPQQIGVNDLATLRIQRTSGSNDDKHLVIRHFQPDGTLGNTIISDPITIFVGETITRFYANTFTIEGRYQAYISTPGSSAPLEDFECGSRLLVGNPAPPGFDSPPSDPFNICPHFNAFVPSGTSFTEGQNIVITYQPGRASIQDYKVHLFKPGRSLGSGTADSVISLTTFGPLWLASLGTPSAVTSGSDRSYDAVMIYQPLTLPATTPIICETVRFFVNEEPEPTPAVGVNPCDPDGDGVGTCPTAFGNINFTPTGFARSVLRIGTGLAGGLALILMVIGAIRVLTSQGDQQRLVGGREMIIAAIAGLLFVILAVSILRLIGIQLFGFNFG